MAYRLNYSDYATASGPPDPASWVGPPGPMGPPGPQGVPGPLPAGAPFLPLTGGTVSGDTHFTATIKQGYATTQPTWANGPGNDAGVGWYELIAEAQFYTKTGGIAVAAVGRASDYHRGTETPQVYAFAGYGVADVSPGTAEGMYLEAASTVVGATAICLEMDSINAAGPAPTLNSYQLLNAGATVGLVIAAGGGPGRPGPLYNSSAAIAIGSNRTVHNNGIVFGATSLNGTDGVTGRGIAIEMAKGHEIQWTFNTTGARSSFIRSDMNVAAGTGILFQAGAFYVVDTATESPQLSVTATGSTYAYGSFTAAGATTLSSVTANGAATLNSGLSFANAVAPGGVTDLSKHIMLGYGNIGFNITSGALNYLTSASAVHSFFVNGVQVATIGANGIMTGSSGSPTWTSGSGAPAATTPPGSLYSRTGGTTGSRLYVSAGGGTWAAVAGV